MFAPACGSEPPGGTDTEGSGGSTGTSGDTAPTTGAVPPIDGDDCGPDVFGWNTECFVEESFLRFGFNADEDQAETIPDAAGENNSVLGFACCEGLAADETANQACAELCRLKACERARSNHLDLATQVNSGFCVCQDANCGFDAIACLTGDWHQQTIDCAFNDQTYFLRAACTNAYSNETVNEDGFFDWREIPDDDPANNPAMCGSPFDVDRDPRVVVSDYEGVEDSETTARLTWTLGGITGVAVAQNALVRLAYDMHGCEDGERCLDLGELHVSLPMTKLEGILVQNAYLVVYQVDAEPVVRSNGTFTYAPGTLHVIMSAVAGGVPFVLRRTNVEPVRGRLSPESDTLTFFGLKFAYTDTVISTQLQIDLVGRYIERGPTAVIIPEKVPRECDKPVHFRAVSSDPDDKGLKHVWWVPDMLVGSGPTLKIALPNGDHNVALISRDNDGHMDATALTYRRACE